MTRAVRFRARAAGLIPASALLALWCVHAARAQAFVVTGGSSTISHAHGGALELRTNKSTGRLDIGSFGGAGIGLSRRQNFRGMRVDAGDQPIVFGVPTDVSDATYYFLGRGIGVERKGKNSRLDVFGGWTSNGFRAPFLSVARSQSAAGAVLYERRLSKSVQWVSRNLFARRTTSLQSVEWQPRDNAKLAMTGGLGGGDGYWASTAHLDERWMIVDGGYTRSGIEFRRIAVESPRFAESDRERLRLELIPASNLRFVVTRENFLSSPDSGLPDRATVNGFGLWTSLKRTQFNGSVFTSKTRMGQTQALALGTRREITRRLEAGMDYLSQGRLLSHRATLMATVRETLNARISLTQVVTRSNGQTSISYGGSFLSNLFTFSADYQTVFLPFVAPQEGQLRQVMRLSLHFQLPHGVQAQGDTSLDPTGKVRYTGYATTYGYRAMAVSAGTSASGGFFRYVVRGRVVDAEGQPVEGAAVRIGKELAFTNSVGEFYMRVKQPSIVPFAVVPEEFSAPGRYEVRSSPRSVAPARDGEEQVYEVVLRRLPNASQGPEASPQEVPQK